MTGLLNNYLLWQDPLDHLECKPKAFSASWIQTANNHIQDYARKIIALDIPPSDARLNPELRGRLWQQL